MKESKEHKTIRLKFIELRKNSDLSYHQLSQMLEGKLHPMQIRNMESGKRKIHLIGFSFI